MIEQFHNIEVCYIASKIRKRPLEVLQHPFLGGEGAYIRWGECLGKVVFHVDGRGVGAYIRCLGCSGKVSRVLV